MSSLRSEHFAISPQCLESARHILIAHIFVHLSFSHDEHILFAEAVLGGGAEVIYKAFPASENRSSSEGDRQTWPKQIDYSGTW